MTCRGCETKNLQKEKILKRQTELKLSSLEALDFLLAAKAAGFSLTLFTAASYPLETRHHPVVVLGIAGVKTTGATLQGGALRMFKSVNEVAAC